MSYELLTCFGSTPDDLAGMSLFHVYADQHDAYPDWASSPIEAIHQIATTNQYDLHMMGYGPARLTLSLGFDNRTDFDGFWARLHTAGVLQLIAGFTRHDSTVIHLESRDYARYPDTTLYRIDGVRFFVGGSVECTATFMREESLL